MEEKKYRIEKVIDSINRVFMRKNEALDWDDVAEIVQSVSLDQKADEHHWDADQEKFIDSHRTAIRKYFADIIAAKGEVATIRVSQFRHCSEPMI